MNKTFSILLISLAVTMIANATEFVIVNNCGYDVWVGAATSVGSSPIGGGVNLGAGQSTSAGTEDWAGNMFVNSAGSLAEFSVNQWGGQDFYDISLIVGFNVGVEIQPSSGVTVICTSTPCSDAYMNPNQNWETHGTGTGGTFQVTFCP